MSWSDIYLLCFAVGALWALASMLLGGFHLGHSGHGHFHAGHGAHAPVHGHGAVKGASPRGTTSSWAGAMVNPSSAAVYLAWFGGVGYLLTRHSGLGFWIDLAIAIVVGLVGAWCLAAFLRFLQSREQPMDPADYEMVGVLGRVASPIRPNGVGEVIYVRDGARRPLNARSEDAREIARGAEVVVTRYEKGIAYVRTWEAMTQSGMTFGPESSPKEQTNDIT